MRRGGFLGSAFGEVGCRGLSGKGAMGSVVVVEVLEAVEYGVDASMQVGRS